MESPRVAFISSYAQLGGAELWLERLVADLPPANVAGVLLLADGPFAASLRARGVPVTVVDAAAGVGMAAALPHVRRLIADLAPDVVHANQVKAALVTILALAGTRTPIVWSRQDFTRRSLSGLVARLSRATVCISDALRRDLPRAAQGRAVVASGGIAVDVRDRRAARTALESATGFDSDARIILHAGRLHPGKGQLELLRALPAILDAIPQARVAILGGADRYVPRHAAAVRAAARQLGEAVRLLDFRNDALDLICGADVLAVPSVTDPLSGWREGFGFVAGEAMALGTPVVAFASGALPEVLGDAGVLVAPGDTVGLATAIVDVLADAGLRERLTRAARQRAKRYEMAVVAERVRAVYAEAARAS